MKDVAVEQLELKKEELTRLNQNISELEELNCQLIEDKKMLKRNEDNLLEKLDENVTNQKLD